MSRRLPARICGRIDSDLWKIEPRLYLGDYRSGEAALAGEEQVLDPEGKLAPFAGVVSLCPMPLGANRPLEGPRHRNTEWLRIPIADGGAGEDELEQALAVVFPFVERRMKHGNVLVHCAAGMSRSVSVVAAWLCRSGRSLDDALEQIAAAKTEAMGPPWSPGWLVISPAEEFLSCLRRIFADPGQTPGS